MATVTSRDMGPLKSTRGAALSGPAHQAYLILDAGFALLPIIAGVDKFFELLVDWDIYLCEPARAILGEWSHAFMLAVGVIEIAAGLGVALRPQWFAYVVALWLMGIVVNLLLTGTYFDIALRDFGLALGALALGRLSHDFGTRRVRS